MASKQIQTNQSMVSKTFIACAKMIIGTIMLTTALLGYLPQPHMMHELTCLSNMICGAAIGIDGLLYFWHKRIPSWMWHCILACMVTVATTILFELAGCHCFNFRHAFFFLHGVNPLAAIALYVCTNPTHTKYSYFMAPIGVMLYALFDIIRFAFTGKLVYGLIPIDMINVASIIIIGIYLYLAELAVVYLIAKLTRTLHK